MQAINLLFDERAQALRDGARDLSNGSSQPPAIVLQLQHPKGDELVHHPHHEERIAVRALVHGTRQLGRKRMPAETLRQIRGDMRLAQEREGDVLALAPHPQLLNERAQGMRLHDDIHRAIAADHQKARCFLAARQHAEQVEGRIVAPVEILDHQQERGRGGQCLDGFRHLTQHALLGDPEQLAAQRLAIAAVFQPRQLHQPGGGVGLEYADHALGPGFAQQSSKRLEDRQIRLRRPVVLEAGAARNQQIRIGRGASQKCVEHRGLADAGFTGEEHELTLAGEGVREPVLELREHPVAADQCVARISRRRDLGLPGTGGDEAVAPARHGLDEGRRRRIVTERAADLQDDDLEYAVADVGLGPPGQQQLLF